MLLPAGNGRGAPLDHRRRSDGIRRETPSSGSSRSNRLATVRSQRAALPDLPRVSVDFTAGRADHCPSQGVTVPFPGDRGHRSVVAVRPRSARHGLSPGPHLPSFRSGRGILLRTDAVQAPDSKKRTRRRSVFRSETCRLPGPTPLRGVGDSVLPEQVSPAPGFTPENGASSDGGHRRDPSRDHREKRSRGDDPNVCGDFNGWSRLSPPLSAVLAHREVRRSRARRLRTR